MLALTPMPLQTAGERALFAELARWDTGGAVRAAVVASIPVVTDGALQRRLSDAVLLVPEGLAVMRIVEVVRQSGVVTAKPEGPWTIGPGAGPGEVLQLGGGGSTPLDGLMRAGMDAAMRLRRAGLEPGRIARLTVLVGENLTGLEPPDGDLGEGDQVALCEPRSLLLGIARSSRYSSVDNPRLWTTADVRAALEALGLQGRGPTVEELNGEGFPYSPYVLRRPELLTPASMTATPSASTSSSAAFPSSAAPSSTASAPAAASPVAAGAPAAAPSSGIPDTAAAVAASIASAKAAAAAAQGAVATTPVGRTAQGDVAQGAVASPAAAITGTTPLLTAAPQAPTAPTGGPVRDTVSLGLPSQGAGPGGAEPSVAVSSAAAPSPDVADGDEQIGPDDTDGIGGLFASAERDEPRSARGPRTAVLPAQAPPEAPPAPPTAPAAPPVPPTAPAAPPEAAPEQPGDRAASRRRLALGLLAAAGVVLLLVVAGVIVLLNRHGGSDAVDAGATSSAAPRAPQLEPGHTQEIDGITFTLEAVRVDDTCRGHSYGQVAVFFLGTDCTHLSRALYSAEIDGHPMVAAVSRVVMPNDAAAGNLRGLADTNNTGNVSDLLREGIRYDGGPQRLSHSEYASSLNAKVVTIVETAWSNPASAGGSGQLDTAASDGLGLTMPTN